MSAPVIEIGTAGEAGVFFGGVMLGIGAAVKTTKWIKEIIGARNGTAPRFKYTSNGNGKTYLTADEHKRLCELAGKATGDVLKSIQEDLRDSNSKRATEVQRLFEKMDANHDDLRDRLGKHGERIASLEAEVRINREGK